MKLFDKIKVEFKKYDFELTHEQISKFEIYVKFLLSENEKYNLTAIKNEEEIILKHFIDSVLPINLFENGASVVDIGAGAGFPSVPLMILRNDLHFLIIDSVNKKINFIKQICEQLNLTNCECLHGRCEDIARNSVYREKYDYCVARGVANLSSLLEYCAGFVKNDGKIIAYKSLNYENEMENSKNAIKLLNLKYENNNKYILFDNIKNEEIVRNILVFKKLNNLQNKYPRQQNKVRTQPLN